MATIVTMKAITIPAASRQRMLRDMRSGLEHVAYAAHGVDQVRLSRRVEFLAQVADVDLNRVRLYLEVVTPDLLEQGPLHHHLAGVTGEELKQLVFASGQVDVAVTA